MVLRHGSLFRRQLVPHTERNSHGKRPKIVRRARWIHQVKPAGDTLTGDTRFPVAVIVIASGAPLPARYTPYGPRTGGRRQRTA